MQLFQRAIAEIGNVSADELSAHVEKTHGVKIDPSFIPLFRATLQDLEKTARSRQQLPSSASIPPTQTT